MNIGRELFEVCNPHTNWNELPSPIQNIWQRRGAEILSRIISNVHNKIKQNTSDDIHAFVMIDYFSKLMQGESL